MWKSYLFTHPHARAVRVSARTPAEAWRRLARTHEAYYHRDGWKLTKIGFVTL